MVRALVAAAFGGPEVLEIIDVPGTEPGPGQVTIAVRASGVNPIDAKIAAGTRGGDASKLPIRLGYEASGVVTAVGDDPVGADGRTIRVGDDVLAFRITGAHASEVTVPAKHVLAKPAELGFPEAAGLLLVGTTAVHALETVHAAAGETILVHGGGGSVGRAVIQLAALRGARVIATASPRRHESLRELGAEPIAYGDGLEGRVRALAERVDAAIDCIGTEEAADVSFALVAEPERVVTIVDGPRFQSSGGRYIGGGPGADPGTELRDAARPELVRLAAAGELSIPVVRAYPLERAREAFEFLAEGHAGGKIVLEP